MSITLSMISRNEEETMRFAQSLAQKLEAGDVVCLHGNLGMGKTVLARGLIRSLNDDPALEVPSPTFSLVQVYDTPKGEVWHFDLYRLKEADEVYELGWEDALSHAINIIEWPERLGALLPENRLDIHLSLTPDGERLLQIEPQGVMKYGNVKYTPD